LGRQGSIVFYRRNNGMPQKGVIEKAEKTAGDFLWMPEVTTPFYDILKSVLQTGKFIGAIVVAGFGVFMFYTIYMEVFRLTKSPFVAGVGALVLIAVGTSVLLLIIVAIGFVFSPVTLFGIPIFRSYPNTCPPTHPELNGLLCYKPCPSGRHRVSDVGRIRRTMASVHPWAWSHVQMAGTIGA